MINSNGSRRSVSVSLDDEAFKKKYFEKFVAIVDIFVQEINERFEPKIYEPLMQLYNCFITDDYNNEINFKVLNIYKNILDFERFKCENKAFVKPQIGHFVKQNGQALIGTILKSLHVIFVKII